MINSDHNTSLTQRVLLAIVLCSVMTMVHGEVFRLDTSYIFIDDVSVPSLIDREHTFQLADVVKTSQWTYNPEKFDYSQDLGAYVWLKFKLDRAGSNHAYIFHLYNGLIPDLKLYEREGGQLILIDSLGSTEPLETRRFYYRDPIIELPYREGVTEYYVRVYAKYYHGFDIAIRQLNEVYNYSLREYFSLGVFYGVLCLIFLYNLFLFFQLREKLFLSYGIYVFMAILSSASTDLTGYWNFWYNHPELNKLFVDQSKWMLSLTFVIYGLTFLNLKTFSRKWFWLVVCTSTVYVVYNFGTINLLFPTRVTAFIAVLAVHLCVFWLAAFKTWKSGVKSAGFFVIGLSVMMLAFIGYYLRFWELIPVNVPTSFILHYGIFAEVLILTYAMSYRMRVNKEDKIEALSLKAASDKELIEQFRLNNELKEKVNLELESKVKVRTKELEEANALLQEQKDKIFEMNDELSRMTQQLYKDKKEHQRARVWKKNLSLDEFKEIFPSKVECYHFIKSLKDENAFSCAKCGNDTYSSGTGLLSKRCTKCGYNESITAGTIFKGVKTPLENNFYMLYILIESGLALNATQVSEQSGLGVKSAWNFKKQMEEIYNIEYSTNWVDYILLNSEK